MSNETFYCYECRADRPLRLYYDDGLCAECAATSGNATYTDAVPSDAGSIALEKERIAREEREAFDLAAAVKQEQAERVLARRRLLPFIKRINPDYDPGWVHADICQRLEKFAEAIEQKKSPRLMIFMPPRHGKSEIGSKTFPGWYLGRNPKHEVIACSYSGDLAKDFSRKVRDLLETERYQSVFKTRLAHDSKSVERWNTTEGGGFVAAGVQGPITGRGAHCFPAGTLVATPAGPVDISRLAPDMSVFTCNIDTGRIEESTIRAVRRHERDRILTIATASGKSIRVTHDHRLFVPAVGWVEARYLRAGDPVCVLDAGDTLRQLRDPGPVSLVRGAEEGGPRQYGSVLLSGVPCTCEQAQVCEPGLPEQDCGQRSGPDGTILQPRVSMGVLIPSVSGGCAVPGMRDDVPADLPPDDVLFSCLCERGSFSAYAGCRELALQRWDELRAVVSEYETTDTRPGPGMRRLWQRFIAGCPPHKP